MLNVRTVYLLYPTSQICFDILHNLNSKMYIQSLNFPGLLKEIDDMAEDYLNNVRMMSGEKRKEHLGKIQSLFNKSKEFGDDKVQLAMQTYEMVRHVVPISPTLHIILQD